MTDSAHTTLILFWSGQSWENELTAVQISERKRILTCRYMGEIFKSAENADSALREKFSSDIYVNMERIRLFKGSPVFGKFYIVIGAIFAILGLIVSARNLTDGFDTKFTGGDWSFVFFTFQGILFLIMGYSFLNSGKYFIEWDDNEIRYLLPYTRKTEVVRVDEIESADIKLFEIELSLKEGSKIISLENLGFEDLRKIKKKFSGFSVKERHVIH